MLITITLEVTATQMVQIAALTLKWKRQDKARTMRPSASTESRTFYEDPYKAPAEALKESVEQVITEDVRPSHVEPTVRPSPGKGIKMPSFGRTQNQLDSFYEQEQERFDKKTEEEFAKEERAEVRAATKAAKQQLLDEKKADKQRAEDEVTAIKETAKETPTTTLLKKPWDLSQL